MSQNLSKKILLYSIIAYGITWIIAFGIFFLFKEGDINKYKLNLYHSFAAIGPTVSTFITTYFFYGRTGLKKLIGKIGIRALDKETIMFIISPVIFFGFGLIIYAIIKSKGYSFGDFASLNWSSFNETIVWLLPLITYPIFEEIGWRGFLLPHLQEKYSAWKATIFLTIIWALWHIPFFFYRFDFSLGISIGFFFGLFVGAIILTSIYNSSKGMLLPVMLLHFLNNICSEFDKEIIVSVLSVGFIFVAIYIYIKFGKENLSHLNRMKIYFLNNQKKIRGGNNS